MPKVPSSYTSTKPARLASSAPYPSSKPTATTSTATAPKATAPKPPAPTVPNATASTTPQALDGKTFTDGFGGAVYGSKNPAKTLNLDADKALTNEHVRLSGIEADARTAGQVGKKNGGASLPAKTNFFATSFGAVHTAGAYQKSAGPGVPPPEAMKRRYHANVHDLTQGGTRVSISNKKDAQTKKAPHFAYNGTTVDGADKYGRTPARDALQSGSKGAGQYNAPPSNVAFHSTFTHSEQSDAAKLMAPGAAKDIAESFKTKLPPGSKIHAVTYNGHTTRFTCANCEYTTGHLAKNPALFRAELSKELQAQGFAVPKGGVRLLPVISAHANTAGVRQNPPADGSLKTGTVDLKPLAANGGFIESPLANVK